MKHLAVLIVSLFIIFNSFTHAQWEQTYKNGTNSAGFTESFASLGSNLFASIGQTNSLNLHGVFISSDSGKTWSPTGMTTDDYCHITSNGNSLFTGTSAGVYLSTDKGLSWTPENNGFENVTQVNDIAYMDTNIFAAFNGSVYLSTNNGSSWTNVSSGLLGKSIVSLAVKGNLIFAGGYEGFVFLSGNNGTTWENVTNDLALTYVNALGVNGADVYCGTDLGVFVSNNNGVNWKRINGDLIGNKHIYSLAFSGNTVFASAYDDGIYMSTDFGTSWNLISWPQAQSWSVSVNDGYLFAGTSTAEIWRIHISDLTGVSNEKNNMPLNYSLKQNYPNPFNPSTTISYALPFRSMVTVKVYSIIGAEIASLVNGEQEGGVHNISFNASGLPSGVYFYSLKAGSYSETKKLMLLK